MPQIIMEAMTRRISFRTPQRVRTTAEVLPICRVVSTVVASILQERTYQEDDRDVEHKGAETVKEESEQANVVNLSH